MLFVRANSIILLFSISLNPVLFAGNILGVKENIGQQPACSAQDASGQNTSEDILAKDYCQKLNKHVAILQQFNEFNKKHKIVDFGASNNAIFNIKNIEYKNEIIKICIAKMIEQKSLEPFFKTWDYAYSLCISNRDIGFVREFSIVVFSLYENLLTFMIDQKMGGAPAFAGNDSVVKKVRRLLENNTSNLFSTNNNEQMRSLLDDIIQVYNAVSQLPIKEIIVTLEKCYVLFAKILNDYGANSGLSFKEWIQKYWWLPPTIIMAIIGTLLRKKVSEGVRSLASKLYGLNEEEGVSNIQK